MMDYKQVLLMDDKDKKVSVLGLFRYMSKYTSSIVLASVCSFIHGTTLPIMVFLTARTTKFLLNIDFLRHMINEDFQEFMQHFQNNATKIFLDTSVFKPKGCADFENFYKNKNNTYTCEDVPIEGRIIIIMAIWHITMYAALGLVVLLVCFVSTAMWMRIAEHQYRNLTEKLFSSLLAHDINWFENRSPYQLNDLLTVDIHNIKVVLSDRMGTHAQRIGTTVAGLGIAFYFDYVMAGILSVFGMAHVGTACLDSYLSLKNLNLEKKHYKDAGIVARNALYNMRVITAFGTQNYEIDEFKRNNMKFEHTRAKAFGRGLAAALTSLLAILYIFIPILFAKVFIHAVFKSKHFHIFITVFFCVVISTYSCISLIKGTQYFEEARRSAFLIYSIIDEVKPTEVVSRTARSLIPSSKSSEKRRSLIGDIKFKNVTLVDETEVPRQRQDIKKFVNLDMHFPAKSCIALVGLDDISKEAIIELLLCFKTPSDGQILLDDKPFKNYGHDVVRANIGYLTKNPVMFSVTIANNIRYRKDDASEKEIIKALKLVDAWDIVQDLPNDINCVVGTDMKLGVLLRQKIRLATALINDPSILILDEVEANIEGYSRDIFRNTLKKVMEGRTTIIIPIHPDDIPRKCQIFGFRGEKLVEVGTHHKLSKLNGVYKAWCEKQEAIISRNWEHTSKVSRRSRRISSSHLSKSLGSKSFSMLSKKQPGKSMVYRKSLSAAKSILGHNSVIVKGMIHENSSMRSQNRKARPSVFNVIRGKAEPEMTSDEDSRISQLFRLNANECPRIVAGSLAAIALGVVNPLMAYYFSYYFEAHIWATHSEHFTKEKLELKATFKMGFFLLAIYTPVFTFLYHTFFTMTGARLTQKIRHMTFISLMKQDMAFYDDYDIEQLLTTLRDDPINVRGLTGKRVGYIMYCLVNVAVSILWAMASQPKFACLMMVNLPIMFYFAFKEVRLLGEIRLIRDDSSRKSSKIAIETFRQMRTVIFLSAQQTAQSLYMKKINHVYKRALSTSTLIALNYAICRSIMFFAFSSAFIFAAWLLETSEARGTDIFKVLCFIIFGIVGLIGDNGINVTLAGEATRRLMTLIATVPDVEPYTSFEGNRIKGLYKSRIIVSNLTFEFPRDPQKTVLHNCYFFLEAGSRVCLAGASGSGPSAILDLLMRFYNPSSGQIFLLQNNIQSLHINFWRSQIGLMFSKPHFFARTIEENLAYGDKSRNVSKEEMEWALKEADLFDDLQNKMDSYCEDLDHIQKLKLHLAQLLIRNPKVIVAEPILPHCDNTAAGMEVFRNLCRVTTGRYRLLVFTDTDYNAFRHADRIIAFKDGRIIGEGFRADVQNEESPFYSLMAECCGWSAGVEGDISSPNMSETSSSSSEESH